MRQSKIFNGVRRLRIPFAVLLLLVVQSYLFSRSFSYFFNGDSLFFFSRRLTTWSDLVERLTSVDDLYQYRPLSYILFSYLFYPLFKLEPFGYHFIPLAFYFANTTLFFLLLRRLCNHRLAAVAGAVFFSAHPLNFYLTYDVAFLSLFSCVFFYLLSITSFLKFDADRKAGWLAVSLVAFILSLLAEERAVTLPFHLMLSVVMAAGARGAVTGWRGLSELGRRSFKRTAPFLGVLAAYLSWHLIMKDGHLYPQSAEQNANYVLSVTLENLASKFQYFKWAINIPEGTVLFSRRALGQQIVFVALLLFWFSLAAYSGWAVLRRNWLVIGGLLWFPAALAPVVFIGSELLPHHFYLPTMGVAFVVGSLVGTGVSCLRRRGLRFGNTAMVGLFVLLVVSSAMNVKRYLKDSWVVSGSVISGNCLADMRRMHPVLPRDTVLYVLKTSIPGLAWHFDGGRMFGIFYGDESIRTLFADLGDGLPISDLYENRAVILVFSNGHLYDVTDDYADKLGDFAGYRLLDQVDQATVSFGDSELSSGDKMFETPGGKPVFVGSLVKGSTAREAIITIAGASVSFGIPALEPEARLDFAVSSVHDFADGAEGRVYFEWGGKRELLYTKFLAPARHPDQRKWFDATVELGKYAGRKGNLILACQNKRGTDPVGDWVAWSVLRLGRADKEPERSPPTFQKRHYSLIDALKLGRAQVILNDAVFRGSTVKLGTPTGRPVFVHRFARGGEEREAMLVLAGASAWFKPPRPERNSFLKLGVAMPYDGGDGAEGRIYFESDGKFELLYKKFLDPGHDLNHRRWFDETLDLSKYAGKEGHLILECHPGGRGDALGDWMGWSILQISDK